MERDPDSKPKRAPQLHEVDHRGQYRAVKVGPNEPCPCGGDHKAKRHDAPIVEAPRVEPEPMFQSREHRRALRILRQAKRSEELRNLFRGGPPGDSCERCGDPDTVKQGNTTACRACDHSWIPRPKDEETIGPGSTIESEAMQRDIPAAEP